MDATFCPELDAMLRSRSAVGQSGRVFRDLGSLSTENNLATLRSLVLRLRPSRTLEAGLGFGGSAMTIAASHRDLGSAPRRQHTAFDPFQLSYWDNAGLTIIAAAGLDTFVDFRPQPSAVGLARLVDEGAQFGLIYLDGSHLFEDVLVDAYFAFRLLAEDGLVLFDDCVIDHVAAVLSFVRANWSGWTGEVDLSAHHPGGASLRYWIGKRLGRQQLRAFRRTGADTRDWNVPLRQF